jgi:hypothetical protein
MSAVIAVVFAITQAPMPVSGKAPNNGANDGDHASQSTKSDEKPAQTIAPVPAQNDRGDSLKPEPGNAPGDNQQGAVNITNATPMPVQWSLPKRPPAESRWVGLRLKVAGLRLKPPEGFPAESRLKARWAR